VAGAALSNVDNAFANSLRVNRAAGALGGEPGVFSPAQLQAATKSMDPSMRKNAFAAGDALMQGYAEAGKSVLGNRVPDSGTPFRSLATLLAGSALGHGISPEVAMGIGGASLGAAGLYSPMGKATLAHILASRPDLAQPLASVVRGAAPYVAAGAGGQAAKPISQ
jgi:hypothetical protein